MSRSNSTVLAICINNSKNFTGGGVDYSAPSSVQLASGQSNFTFNVSIFEDTMIEGNESFTLAIDQTSLDRVVCGYPCMTTITIVDTTGELLTTI